MLKIRPSLCGYRIFIDKKEVARATFGRWRSRGKLIIQKETLRIAAKGFPIRNRYELIQGKTCVASMTLKMLPLPPSRILEYNHQVYIWKDSHIFHENRELGLVDIRWTGSWIWPNIEVELPETLPLIPQLFIVWDWLDRRRSG